LSNSVPVGGQQFQVPDGRVRETRADPLLLGEDHLGRGLGDRQPPLRAAGLVVVIDQHRRAVIVAGQAAERQRGDLFRAAAGVDGQLGRGAHLRGGQ
jgi:hypothetical protein